MIIDDYQSLLTFEIKVGKAGNQAIRQYGLMKKKTDRQAPGQAVWTYVTTDGWTDGPLQLTAITIGQSNGLVSLVCRHL